MSQNGSHVSGAARDRKRRTQMIVAAVVVGLVAFGGGVVLANLGGDEATAPSSSPMVSSTLDAGSPTPTPTSSPTASASTSPSSSPSASPSAPLPDGESFVYVKTVEGGEEGPLLLTFDLAYLYEGDEANQQAAAHGDPEPADGYYIVNDNPKLRTIPIASSVQVRYIPTSACCELQPGDINAWADAVNGTVTSEYSGANGAWWITVVGGEVVTIEEQYFP